MTHHKPRHIRTLLAACALMTCSCFAQEAPLIPPQAGPYPTAPLPPRAFGTLPPQAFGGAPAAAMPYAPPSAPESGAAFPCPTSLLAPGPHQESPCPGRAMNTSPMAAIVDRRQA